MIYGVTKEELSPTLIEYMKAIVGSNTGGANSLRFIKSTVTLSSNSKIASIDIDEFDKERDLLMVYKNSVYLENNIDYTIDSDSSRIISTDTENWKQGTVFNFVAILNVPELGEYIINGQKISQGSISLDKLDDSLKSFISNSNNIDGGTF